MVHSILRPRLLYNYRWQLVAWLGVIVCLGLIARFGTDVGVTWDEVVQREYGRRVLLWFRSGFRDRSALNYQNLYLYGGLFEVLAQWWVEHSPLGPYETRHIATALVALLGAVGTWKLAACVGGSRAGFCAALLLVLTPAWLGHGLFNSKDIPYGTGAVFAAYAAVRLGMQPLPFRFRDVACAGLCIGAALATRPGGVFLLVYPLLAMLARVWLSWHRSHERQPPATWLKAFGDLALKYAVVILLAWGLMLSAWPWAQQDPIANPLEAIREAANFRWTGKVLFGGEYIRATELPRSYLPVWFALTLPDPYAWAPLCALAAWVARLKSKQTFTGERISALALILLSVALPLTAALVLRPVVYDAQRHFLFLVPSLAALAGLGVAACLGSRQLPIWSRACAAGVFAALCALTCLDIAELHPYEYIYFNRLSGGLPHAFGQYETDYWGASYKEGLAWLLAQPPQTPGRATRVAGCNDNANDRLAYYVERWPGASERVVLVSDRKRADILLAITRFRCDQVPGKILHQIERQGVPLLYVIERPNAR
ncbi:MAG: hypothetical protein RL701_2143 [Pseudomonadota bacterium]|jgi:hypothetical protein